MNRFLKWFKDLVLPFENPEHPLYYDPKREKDFQEAAVRAILGDYLADQMYGPRMNLQPKNTIPVPMNIPSLYGHWFFPEMKPQRDAAREWARQQGYYDTHKQ